ncbi:MAG: hypothetical protein IT373_27655 [Polyangiaceae bacterium]|nr:hypothetical protein [Polyangiaceae bacterium]
MAVEKFSRRRSPLWVALLAFFVGCTTDDAGTGGAPGGDDDGDTISNADEGSAEARNTDGDAYPDARDHDSDGDGLSDALEAGDADLATPPVDTDGDGTPDYRDLDSDGDAIDDTDELDAAFAPVDTDGDGLFDHLDLDADGDSIADAEEGGIDFNGDGSANFRDLDADGDGIPDELEAGDADLATPARDTDGDGAPDFLDLDSDNDYVPDREEDKNGNGVVDPGESSPLLADTDGDGTPDVVEVIAGSDPNDPSVNIPAGDFYFVLPYQGPGQNGPLDFATTVKQADIFFSMDTTGSFGQEITALQTTLEQVIVPGIAAVVSDAAFGVGRFEDMPVAPFGLPGDKPYELLRPVTTDIAAVTAGLALLPPAAGGLDIPEAGFEALYQWASGTGIPALGYLPFAPPGIGGAGFRPDSLPIIVQITDATSHAASDYAGVVDGAHDRNAAVAALQAIGARVIGIDSLENVGTPDDPRAYLEDLAIATKALIPPDVGTGECLTGVAGAPRAPVDVGGTLLCPVVFDVLPDGTGLGTLIVDAVAQLATLGVLDISTRTVGQTQGLKGEVLTPGHTTADFIKAVTPVPPPPAGATISGDVFLDVTPGSTVTFDVQGFNDFQPSTLEDQLFAADIEVLGDAVTVLDVRGVYIIVPRASGPIPN